MTAPAPAPAPGVRRSDPAPERTRPWLDAWLLRLPRHDQIAPLLDDSELDDRERRRAASFLRPADAVLYLCAHIALRRVLAPYLRRAPAHIPFLREPCPGCGAPHGRPAVDLPGPPVHFSLSHSRGMALVAVASAPVGADVERVPRPDTVDLCALALHPDEQRELAATAPGERHAVFGRVWTRKEAYLKGLGTGLSRQPRLDYLGADTARRPAGWSVIDLSCTPHHNGAIALKAPLSEPATVHRLPLRVLYADGAGTSLPPGTGLPPPTAT